MHQREWNQAAENVAFNLEIDVLRFLDEVQVEHDVLDFGCGYGRISKLLKDSGYRNIVGIDSSEAMIKRGKREHPELDLLIATDSKLPFIEQRFDAIIACAVFTCITDHAIRELQIKELYRVLKPGGLLHMVEFCSDSSKLFTSSIGVPMLHSSPNELRELVAAFNITCEEVVKTNTMGGNVASSLSLFARKPLNKAM